MSANVFFESTSELATLNNTFSVNGIATDPASVSVTVTAPSGVETTYSYAASQVIRDSAGAYHIDITSSEAGTWSYLWVGTGAASDAASGSWTVLPTRLGRLYATVEDLKSRLGIDPDDTVDDFELHGACLAASRTIEQTCQRVFWRTATGTARYFDARAEDRLCFGPFNDLVSLSGLATDISGTGVWSTSWATTDWQLYPLNTAGPETRPYTDIRAVGSYRFPLPAYGTRAGRVQITGVWGWPSVPWAIREATLIQAAELYRLRDAPFGVAGFGELGVVRIRDNPVAARLTAPYRLRPVLVA